MHISRLGFLAALVVVFGTTIQPAHAYIDPGTGSSLFSSLGIMLGAMVTMFAFGISQFRRCSGWFWARLHSRNSGDATSVNPTSRSTTDEVDAPR